MRKKINDSIDKIKLDDEDKTVILNKILNHEAKVINLKFVYSSLAVCLSILCLVSYDGKTDVLTDQSSLIRTISNDNIMYKNTCFIQTNYVVVDDLEFVDNVLVDELNFIENEIYINSGNELCLFDGYNCYLLKECEGEL